MYNLIIFFCKFLFKHLLFKVKTNDKVIYLTFDDGPTPDVTDFILRTLDNYNAKATFFCLGRNIIENFDIFSNILKSGHSIGNHTYNHLKGCSTKNAEYYEDILKFDKIFKTKLFRPPYGKIKISQINYLKKKYRIVFWSVISYDYKVEYSKEKCLKKILTNTKPGSIVLLHDNLKSSVTIKYLLPEILNYYSALGYKFGAIE